jgi:hypothetical protein
MPYELCDKLCNLTEAAANVYTMKKDLLDALVQKRTAALKGLTAHTFAAGAGLWSMAGAIAIGVEMAEGATLVTSAAGASAACAAAAICWPAALAGGTVMVMSSIKAVGHYQEKTALEGRKRDCEFGDYTTFLSSSHCSTRIA